MGKGGEFTSYDFDLAKRYAINLEEHAEELGLTEEEKYEWLNKAMEFYRAGEAKAEEEMQEEASANL